MASGGKRLRPLLVGLGHELADGSRDDVLGAASAVELVHTWALLHDDLIDASATRRGAPTTHERFARHHRNAGWHGGSNEWGAAIAILAGDFVAVLADDALAQSRVSPPRLANGRGVFSRLRREVMAGQVLDVTAAARGQVGVERALRIATLKSGRYSVTRPLELGATLAGADPGLQDTLRHVGDALGVAFQLRDDLLGLFGDAESTGKPVGDDLREGKRTVVVAEALDRLDDRDAARLEAVLGDRAAGDEVVATALELIDGSGARTATTTRLQALLDSASTHLEDLPEGSARTALLALADHIATRRH